MAGTTSRALDEVVLHALAASITGAAPGSELRARLRSTAGNPLFASELLRSFDEEGLLRIESGIAEVLASVTPAGSTETLDNACRGLRSRPADSSASPAFGNQLHARPPGHSDGPLSDRRCRLVADPPLRLHHRGWPTTLVSP